MRTELEIRERLAELEKRFKREMLGAERCHKKAEQAGKDEEWDEQDEWRSYERCYKDCAAAIEKIINIYKWVLNERENEAQALGENE